VLAGQVAELQQQLDRENEQLEQEIGVLSQSLDREMGRLWPMAGALREPLDRVEQPRLPAPRRLRRVWWRRRGRERSDVDRPRERG
jgi:hypothetical protein